MLDEVRREAAHRLVTATDVPFAQVAAMVGLSAQSGLTRAVRRWFDTTPTALRRAQITPHRRPSATEHEHSASADQGRRDHPTARPAG
ncbi:helix-turn-helix domain-containing protein [Pseudonocardia pini]|uniref:helix-turn-helix domain-containing protein n=1 Tax=Pseudonocardia pini TaxID=2758030 RepID=UPI0028A863E9|nr:helix-turn-helix domain-containing protein [Pseudonocardia pini]